MYNNKVVHTSPNSKTYNYVIIPHLSIPTNLQFLIPEF